MNRNYFALLLAITASSLVSAMRPLRDAEIEREIESFERVGISQNQRIEALRLLHTPDATPSEILGVPAGASRREVLEAYSKLMTRWNPAEASSPAERAFRRTVSQKISAAANSFFDRNR